MGTGGLGLWAAGAKRRGGAVSRQSCQRQLCRWKQAARGGLGWTTPSAWKPQAERCEAASSADLNVGALSRSWKSLSLLSPTQSLAILLSEI